MSAHRLWIMRQTARLTLLAAATVAVALTVGLMPPSAAYAQGAAAANAGPWITLFDGTSLNGWHNYGHRGEPVKGWTIIDGTVTRTGEGGDLTTNAQYTDFELTLDWRVPPKGNSGIIYRIDPASEVSYTSGPEMQVLDDAGHPDGKSRLTSAGADYGLYPSPAGIVKPATEWNSVRLIVRGNHVEHWLNGTQVVTYELGSADWAARVAKSKFAEWAGYGKAGRGYIALQDHGDRVAYRNVRIRELK